MPLLSNTLKEVTTLGELQQLLRETQPSLLDARRERTSLRQALRTCASHIVEVKDIIAQYLTQADAATPETIDGLAADFQQKIISLDTSTNDLPAITKIVLARQSDPPRQF